MLNKLSTGRHCSCLSFEECGLSPTRVSEYSFNVLLWREDFLRGGEGGLGAGITCEEVILDECALPEGKNRSAAVRDAFIISDLESIENSAECSCRACVVFKDEETVNVFEAIFRCTRILVKLGEIGKYSISESSVDRVSGF